MSNREEFRLDLIVAFVLAESMFVQYFAATEVDIPWIGLLGLWFVSFLVGGIPFGFIVGKLNGIDVRNEGSGNIGATNVFRTVGKGWGIFVFVLDFMKAYLPLALYHRQFSDSILPLGFDLFLLISGVLAVVGHNYSPYLGFKGGKGMATSAGFLAGLIPWSLLVCFCAWLVVFITTRYVSLASVVAGIMLPLGTLIFYSNQVWLVLAAFFLGAMSVWRHRSNIVKLRAGTEHRFGSSGNKEPTDDDTGKGDSK